MPRAPLLPGNGHYLAVSQGQLCYSSYNPHKAGLPSLCSTSLIQSPFPPILLLLLQAQVTQLLWYVTQFSIHESIQLFLWFFKAVFAY